MTRTLLDKAKSAGAIKRPKVPIRPGELELTLAYCRGEITLQQYWAAFGHKNSSKYGPATHRIGSVIGQAIASGELQVNITSKKRV